MPLPRRSDYAGIRACGDTLMDGVLAGPQPTGPAPQVSLAALSRPYAYNGGGTTLPEVPLAPARVAQRWPSLCLHDAPPTLADAPFCAPPEWHHELDDAPAGGAR